MTYDLITLGRVGVDLYPQQTGVGLAEVSTFAKYLGGSATNVAVAAARHGLRSAVVTGVGDDPLGGFVRAALRGFGVDERHVVTVPGAQTPVVLCEIFPPDDFPLYFYRPDAPDLRLLPAHLDLPALRAARVVWATGSGLCAEPSYGTTLRALAERDPGTDTVLDLDWRPMFWDRPEDAPARYARALEHATVAVGNRDEVEVAVGTRDPDRAADLLLARGVRLAVVKQGPDGVLARTATEDVRVPPIPVEVVNGLGAGDAFGGALVAGLLAGRPLTDTLAAANAAGALVASRHSCADAMPTPEEIAELTGRTAPRAATTLTTGEPR
ncbi:MULTISPECIES: 5-dehydro-2-deoxygluconokinase [Streptomyces]|uniref:5-dehydro-2-deoxygluconokinase n=1 Tax=Streptomyces TaxID=1883 RepID=UPI0013828349|nr:5-dehydro-2-deoxygluconokinase [Streptomyces sp. SID2888]MYV49498.1 5-dehydro-2-deoxygluconokinase [Streptomyces sp. SID2888]